jgi:hypothetical protein
MLMDVVSTLGDDHAAIREDAYESLQVALRGKEPSDAIAKAVAEGAVNRKDQENTEILAAVGEVGKRATPHIVRCLKEIDKGEKANIIKMVSGIYALGFSALAGDKEAARAVEGYLKHPLPGVRATAESTIGTIKGELCAYPYCETRFDGSRGNR